MGGQEYAMGALHQRLSAKIAIRVRKISKLTSRVTKLRADLERIRAERTAHLDETSQRRSEFALPQKSARTTRSERAWALERRRHLLHLHAQATSVQAQLRGELGTLAAMSAEVADLQSQVDTIESTAAQLSRDRRTRSLDRDDEGQQDRLTGRHAQD